MEMADFFEGLTGARAWAGRSARLQTTARLLPVAATLGGAILIAWHDRGSIAAVDFLPVAVGVALLVAAIVWSGAALRPSGAAVAHRASEERGKAIRFPPGWELPQPGSGG